MLQPPRALRPNGHIAVLAISSPSERARVEEAARKIEQRGYRVTVSENVDHHDVRASYLAGSDAERLEQLNQCLRSDDFDAIFFARGGYGAMRILEHVDYEAIRRNPRPVVGFSDLTALHQAMAIHAGVAAFHGPMLNLDWYNGLSLEIEEWFWAMLRGDAPLTHHFSGEQILCEGEAEGVLFGGCLSLTTSLTATPFDYWVDGGIWFWEDVDEPLYRIDRMLTHLRLSGRLKKIHGVVIGKLKGCGGEGELHALLRDFFGSSGIPAVRNIPFGHYGDNLMMPFGAPVRLSTRDCTLTLTRAAVQQ